jgi:hypothetical protein
MKRLGFFSSRDRNVGPRRDEKRLFSLLVADQAGYEGLRRGFSYYGKLPPWSRRDRKRLSLF